MIASHNKKKNVEIVIFDYWTLPLQHPAVCLALVGGCDRDEGAAARGIATPAGVLPKPSPEAAVFHHVESKALALLNKL